jgi:heptosyltransferase II
VSRILVVTKFRYLGDTIVATPFLRQLKEACPNDSISLLSGPAMPVLLEGCPYLDEIIPFDPKGADRLRRNMALIRDLRKRRFDIVFLVNRSLHTALVALGARIPRRIGFDTEHRGALLTTRVRYDWSKPDRDCALDLLAAVGLSPEAAMPELWVSDDERLAAKKRLAEFGVSDRRMIIGMQPGANDPEVREWGAKRFAVAADLLAETTGAQVILLGSKEERRVSQQVAALTKVAKPAVMTGDTGLREALAIISLCGLWVGNDGGLLHAAVALCPATVGIFGPTKASRWGYDTPRHRTMVVYPEQPAKDPETIRRCLDTITPESVIREALSALEAGG